MPEARLLIIDDESSFREVLRILFGREGYEVQTAASGEDGLDIYESFQPDVVLTDLNMPGIDGLEVLRQVKQRAAVNGRDTIVILVTAYGTVKHAVSAMREGAFDYVIKPCSNDELRMLVRRALDVKRLEADNIRLRQELGERYQLGRLVGTSSRMQEVYALVRRIMGTRINCLITGESGTGKEMLARAIHYGSERSRGPFIAVNCGAIPENLFESELFGYKKGAFTGAARDKIGMFEAANNGTLFLDEIGEMPLAMQVKVLRALAERKVTAVGSTHELAVDVRIVAATNRDLPTEVKGGRFREDLYYRLNVVQIDMPPLRDRKEDIPALVEHFVERFSKEYGKPVRGTTPESMRILKAWNYPGNVRELQNIIERAVALEMGQLITPASLPTRIQGEFAPMKEETDPLDIGEGIDLEARLRTMERNYLHAALRATNGNRTKAAAMLGITFRSFRYRLKEHGLGGDDAE